MYLCMGKAERVDDEPIAIFAVWRFQFTGIS